MFWDGHDPTVSWSSQYRAGLFCEDGEQLAAALRSAERIAEASGHPVATEVTSGKPFYAAEDYHQKYRLRRQPALFDALRERFGTEAEMLASTPAAKLNAHVGGNATLVQTNDALRPFGLVLEAGRLDALAA